MNSLGPYDISIREILSFVFKYKRRLLFAFVIPFLIGVALSFVPTPRYRAATVLIIRLGSEYVYQPEVGTSQGGQTPTIPFDREQIFKSEVAILDSADLHAEALSLVGLDNVYPELEQQSLLSTFFRPLLSILRSMLEFFGLQTPQTEAEEKQARLRSAAATFKRHFDIFLQKESAVMEVSYEHRDAAVAVRVLEALLKLYFEKRKQLYLEPRVNLAQGQVDAAKTRVEATEQVLKDFKQKNQIYSFIDQRESLLKQRAEIEKQLGMLDSRQTELSNLLATLDNPNVKESGKAPVLYEQDVNDSAMANARIRLIDAESRLKDALSHYTKDSPVVAAAEAQVRAARAVVSQSEMDRTRAEAEVGSNKIKRESLMQTLAYYSQQLDQLDALERDFNSLSREAKIAEESYTLFSHNLDEAKAFERLQRDRADSVRVIQQPTAPPYPKKLQLMIILVGFFAGILNLLGVAAITEFLRSGFYTPERLENNLGLPVIATIPLCE